MKRQRPDRYGYRFVCSNVFANAAQTFVMDMILEEGHQGERLLLTSLQDLSLSAVTFKSFVPGLLNTFNMDRLSVLKLVNCQYADRLLDATVTSNLQPRLKVFEFIIDSYGGHFRQLANSLATFLHSFQSLETIYLKSGENSLGGRTVWDDVVQGTSNHQASLERLVLQGACPPYLTALTVDSCDANIPEMVYGTRLTCIEACIRCVRMVSCLPKTY